MSRADLLVKLLKSSVNSDRLAVRRIAEAIIAEERRKGYRILAERLEKALHPIRAPNGNGQHPATPPRASTELFYEITPERDLDSLFLPATVKQEVLELIEEQHRSELLHSYNLKARHRLLFAGPPGNGKTALAEALAHSLMCPLIVIRYESLIGSYLGETSGRIKSVLEYAKTIHCVLFFDEFETLGKERGDSKETGEIKRVVSSLLLQTDALPDYVVLVAASNHPELLDKAVWRRFQVRVNLPLPTCSQLCQLIEGVAKRCKLDYGYASETIAKKLKGSNYAEAEQFCLDIARRAVLGHKSDNAKAITSKKLNQWQQRLQPCADRNVACG